MFIDTEIYFVIMAVGILLWSQYVVKYLRVQNRFRTFLTYAGRFLCVYVLIVTPLNRLSPIMFWFDEAGVYQAGPARDVMFIYQVVLLLLTAVYTLFISVHSLEKMRKRYLTIGFSGLIMMFFVTVQILFPTYPLYAISYMLGCCLLRTFVIENEREEYRLNLESSLEREKKQFLELKTAWSLAYTDAMTGVKSKLAYAEKGDLIDRQLAEGTIKELAIVVFDVNDLKVVNDTLGHDVGDEFIKRACRLICAIFKQSPVYRVGGDEFVTILEGHDYENREQLIAEFNQEIAKNRQNHDVVIALGMAEYQPGQDNSYKRIFERADLQMYEQKRRLKNVGD